MLQYVRTQKPKGLEISYHVDIILDLWFEIDSFTVNVLQVSSTLGIKS